MINVDKEYTQSFLLEPTKLARILDKIHERIRDHEEMTSHDMFEVFFTGNRREEMTTLEELLALDNSRKHKITRLVITRSGSSPGSPRPDHVVQVDFPRIKETTSGTSKVVAISVRSDAAGWASRTLSEVEQQVERTWLHRNQPIVILVCLLLIALIFVMSQLTPLGPPLNVGSWWLTESDLDRVEAMLNQQRTLTAEELREVSTMELRNILAARRPTLQTLSGRGHR